MSRPSENNKTQTTVATTNTAAAISNVTHPSGHSITISADYGIWDNVTDKPLLPQDLKRN